MWICGTALWGNKKRTCEMACIRVERGLPFLPRDCHGWLPVVWVIKVRYSVGQGGLSKKAQQVQEDGRCEGIQGNTSKAEIKCVCLNARSIINKKNELNIMVDDNIKPHIIGITESWANNDITDAELGLEGYVMFRKDRMGKGEEKCYYTSRKLYQHMKYSYMRKQIVMGPYGAN